MNIYIYYRQSVCCYPLCSFNTGNVSTAELVKASLISDPKGQLFELVVMKDNKTMCYTTTSDDSVTAG